MKNHIKEFFIYLFHSILNNKCEYCLKKGSVKKSTRLLIGAMKIANEIFVIILFVFSIYMYAIFKDIIEVDNPNIGIITLFVRPVIIFYTIILLGGYIIANYIKNKSEIDEESLNE